MVSASRKAFQEVKTCKGESLNPGSVFLVKHINNIMVVRDKLEEGFVR